MSRDLEPSETKEEFVKRYPRPSQKRVLTRCYCNYSKCTGWSWGCKDDLEFDQELAE